MPDAAPPGSTADEDLERRRREVSSLRLLGKSQMEIAGMLGVSNATISRDMDWIREHYRDAFGRAPNVDPGEIVGESHQLYRELERRALEEYLALVEEPTDPNLRGLMPRAKLEESANIAKVRLQALETVAKMRDRQMALYVELGILDRAGTTAQGAAPLRAAELRRISATAVVTEDMLIPDIERKRSLPVIDVTATEA